jgi:hypothetical protein
MLKDNKFSKDDNLIRAERTQVISGFIMKYNPELNLSPDMLDWALNVDTKWDNMCADTTVLDGRMDNAYGILRNVEQAAAKVYCATKEHLLSILADTDSEALVEDYGLQGKAPRKAKELVQAIDLWKATHDKLVAAGDARVISAVFMDKLMEQRNILDNGWRSAVTNKQLAAAGFKAKRDLFEKDTEKLRFLFSLCKIVWGNQDPKLGALGFLTKSAVWTPKKKEEKPDDK